MLAPQMSELEHVGSGKQPWVTGKFSTVLPNIFELHIFEPLNSHGCNYHNRMDKKDRERNMPSSSKKREELSS